MLVASSPQIKKHISQLAASDISKAGDCLLLWNVQIASLIFAHEPVEKILNASGNEHFEKSKEKTNTCVFYIV